MFQNGPAVMEVNKLGSELDRIKNDIIKDNKFRPFVKTTYEESKSVQELQQRYDDISKSKLDEKDIKREELERLGIPYKVMDEEDKDKEGNKEDEDEDSEAESKDDR
jgi:hypothetical protein